VALNKEIIDDMGQVSTYHRIIRSEQSYEKGAEGVHIFLASYVDTKYRETEKQEEQQLVNTLAELKNDEQKNLTLIQELEHKCPIPRFIKSIKATLPIDDSKGYKREVLYGRLKSEHSAFEDSQDV